MAERSESERLSLVDPRRLAELRRIEFRAKRSVSADLIGQYRSSFRGTGLTFSELRQYQPGDEVKQIHWKATARTGTVYVKSYDEERSLRVMVAADTSASTGLGLPRTKHRKAVEFCALVTTLSRSTGDAVGLLLFSDQIEQHIPVGRSRRQHDRILLSLLESEAHAPGTDLSSALRHLREHERRRSIIFLLSDFFAPPFEEELRLLALQHEVICVQLTDSIDTDLPPVGIVQIRDAESGHLVELDSSSRSTRRFLAAQFERRKRELSDLCQRCGAELISIEEDPLQPLVNLMRRRARRFR